MDEYSVDFNRKYAQTYTEKCKCGKIIEVSTQKDGCVEFYTDVYIRCQFCGESVYFELPAD